MKDKGTRGERSGRTRDAEHGESSQRRDVSTLQQLPPSYVSSIFSSPSLLPDVHPSRVKTDRRERHPSNETYTGHRDRAAWFIFIEISRQNLEQERGELKRAGTRQVRKQAGENQTWLWHRFHDGDTDVFQRVDLQIMRSYELYVSSLRGVAHLCCVHSCLCLFTQSLKGQRYSLPFSAVTLSWDLRGRCIMVVHFADAHTQMYEWTQTCARKRYTHLHTYLLIYADHKQKLETMNRP